MRAGGTGARSSRPPYKGGFCHTSSHGWRAAASARRRFEGSSAGRGFGYSNVRVAEAVTEKAWRLAATLTGDEALGVHLAESLPRGALDLIEDALRLSPSLGKPA